MIRTQALSFAYPGGAKLAFPDAAVALLRGTGYSQGATLVIATHEARVAKLIPPKSDGKNGF